ncbi:MAG TPA: glycosyltransferase [Thermoanaerobaculia bacterium]|jgi:glycosyltransferase involved in cell wall biosynthesis
MLFARDFLADQRIFRRATAPRAPEVSVILPTCSRCADGLLQRALESVLSQSFTDFELIVVDDGSIDGTRDLVLALQAADPRVVYVRHEINCGLPALRVNEGIELALGRWIAFQFDGDNWMEGALETLVEKTRSAPEPAVVCGSAVLHMSSGAIRILPDAEVHLLTLSFENRVANNSVLVPRVLLDRHGLYDCHVGMRRLCDWDLWLRLARHAPFLAVDRQVSRVAVASDATSFGVTVPFELPLFRFLHSIPRDSLLRPGRWRDYEVDALRIGEVEVPRGFRERMERDYILPYHQRVRHAFPHLAPPPPAPSRLPRSLLFTMDSFYGSFEMCMGHYDLPSYRRMGAKMHYQPLAQIRPGWEQDADLLLLVRTVTEPGLRLLGEAAAARIPAGYYLDDDLLHLHEYGPPFDVLAPGTPRRENLVAQLERADAVWATSPVIAESVQPHNPRIVPHNGSIPENWLPADLPPRGAGGPIRISYAGDPYRIEEFRTLWDALRRISEEMGDRLAFEFWGLDTRSLAPLASPVAHRPYTHSYPEFIDHLRRAQLDVLLTPLFTYPRPRLAKAPSRYYHTAVAGSLGIFSDVPQYAMLPHGLTCLKAANDPDSWYAALLEAVTMPPERFDRMRRAMVEHVRLEYTETAQIHLHEAAVRATEFHAATRERRGEDGRPRILYLLSGEPEAAADLARDYGVEAVKPRFFRENREALRALLDRWSPALVHAPEPAPVLREVCADRGIPLVSSCPAILPQEDFDQRLRRILESVAGGATEAEILEARAAYRLDRSELHPQRGANELFALYNRALAGEVSAPAELKTPAVQPPAPAALSAPSRRDRLRERAQKLGVYRPLSRLYWSRQRKRVLVTYDNYIASVFLYWEHALPRLEVATGRHWLLQPADQVYLEDLYSFHAVISARGLSQKSLEILQAAKRSGCRTVYDTDDNLLLVDQAFSDPGNPWRRIFGEARPEIEAMLGTADAVKVYAEPTVPSFRRYNPNVVAIRPYQILDRDAPLPSFEDRRPATVGFLGSYFKDDEWSPVVAAILRLLDEGHPLQFEFFGFLPRALERRPEVLHVPWQSSYLAYRQTLTALEWDVGLAPLRDLEFNRGKNNAKYREYASAWIAGIYSDMPVYSDTIVHRRTGLLVPHEDEQAWYEAILELAGDAGLRQTIQRNAFADLKANYRVEDYVAKVAALLEDPLPRHAARG